MTAVIYLIPGDRVLGCAPGRPQYGATFIAQTVHPIYPRLQLVIWHMDDGTWSHDALSPAQDVGTVQRSTSAERDRRLREALLGEAVRA